MRALALVWLAFAFAAGGCYAPSLHDGQFTCEHSSSCPSGYQCICQVCRKSGTGGSCDLGVAADLSSAVDATVAPDLQPARDLAPTLGGCSSGSRSAQDPGHPNVALCPAAWALPGLSTSTPCGRVVGANGKNGNTACSSEDNCATGWHVCTDESDVGNKGFTKSDCMAVVTASALWVTRQIGAPPPSPGPAVCGGSMPGPVFGCGSYGMPSDANSCHLLQRALLNGMGGSDGCSLNSSGAFSCGTVMGAELNDVTKPMRDTGGGVICCAN